MVLYDKEQMEKEKAKKQKLNRIIIVSIVLLIIIIIALACLAFYLINNPNVVTIYLDGAESTNLEDIIEVTTLEDGTVEIKAPIKEIATYFGYSSYNGTYDGAKTEDKDSCYVESENEVASFILDSNIITKKDLTNSSATYVDYEIENAVTKENDVLYITDDGLEKAFNLYMTYNEKTKTLNIYSLDKMVSIATTSATTEYSSTVVLDETLDNYKAVLEGRIVITTESGYYGVLDFNNAKTEILEPKYDNITYIPQKEVFMIESNGKVGIYSIDGDEKISPSYDSLVLIDDENDLYVVEQDGLYGIINIEEDKILYPEYDEIGIDIDDFDHDNVTTGYVLLDTLIPVQEDGKWGFFDKEGNKITEFIYTDIGCITSSKSSTTYNVLIIEGDNDNEALVVKREDDEGEEKYTFLNTDGEEIEDCVFEDVYIKVTSGTQTYCVVYEDTAYTYTLSDEDEENEEDEEDEENEGSEEDEENEESEGSEESLSSESEENEASEDE